MKTITNCLNCGAPLHGDVCKYCGTTYYDFSSMEINKPCYLKIKFDDKNIIFKAVPTNIDINVNTNSTDILGNNQNILERISQNTMDINVQLCAVYDKDGTIFRLEV